MNAHQRIIKDNARTILKIITKHYGVKYSAALYQMQKEHPDFPSFLSLQYFLQRIGKDSFAMHTHYEELINIPVPFIVHVVTNVDLFLFVTKATTEAIQIMDEQGKTENMTKKDFENIWDGNILIIDTLPGKIKISLKNKLDTFVNLIKYPFLIFCLAALFIYSLILKQQANILFYLFLLAILVGFTTSILLFVNQMDKHNIYVKQLCSTNKGKKNIDCSSILDFKDAYFMGLVSWSDIGFIYFTFLLAVLLILPFDISRTVINILSIFSIGYVFYSLFYQKIIAKKWCTLCLSVQIVFIFLFILSICTLKKHEVYELFATKIIAEIMIIFFVIMSAYIVINSLVRNQKEYSTLKRKFDNLRYDENITRYLFQQEISCTNIDKVNKLSMGKSDAETKLTLIFNPICTSCIKELQILIPIIQRKSNTKLDVVFLLDREKHPESLVIATYLLSDYQKSSEKFITTLQYYVDNYPISKNKIMHNMELLQGNSPNESFIKAQEQWCIAQKIYSTPSLFMNGNKLPNYYNIKDIDYLCN
ncbi:vitamin K epoxide reductase [Bacteroides heparinolyticus]|uniref:Vitamin K epoxide reductase n=1 Tax=Prevotella heparinolytica TaxID=28113 RepID=A0A3P2AEU3_9BACE|nr:vitamin K epoxide reductase family protein [Bacteroides heparinolyticus]RRD92143.1 vitamin K epoxide reductase [Bacteroides heparinolyticus]